MSAHRTCQPIERQNPGYSGTVLTVAAAWTLTLGFDLFLHSGLLSRLYREPSPFLLEPLEAFRRIPLGYLAFLLMTVALYWLLQRLGVRGASAGFRHGVTAGAVVWGAFLVGLYSISTARLALLAGWWVGQSLELGLARGQFWERLPAGAAETDLDAGGNRGCSLCRRGHPAAVSWLAPGDESDTLKTGTGTN